MEEESFKPKVVCISPDDEMGFLINLPPPCNVILQPSTIGKNNKNNKLYLNLYLKL
jgi:hypothetical protein